MGPLLLLTSSLLSSYFHAGSVANAQPIFTINSISLSIEPQNDVTRETNVTLRCQARVLSSEHAVLNREYTIYKDNQVVYTKMSSTTDDLLYPLPDVRVSNTGTYKCEINIDGTKKTSRPQALRVTGLSQPELRLNKQVVNEGEEVTASCTAPGETGSIYFYFFMDNTEIEKQQVNSNQTETRIHFSSTGNHRVHCSYLVFIPPYSFKSDESNVIPVSVKELSVTALLEIFPPLNIYEGDRLDISCTIINLPHSSEKAILYLSKGTKLLNIGETKVNHSMIALANEPGEFECKLQIGNVNKIITKTVSVTELFSVPTLTMRPAEVFHRESMTLTCKSKINAPEKLKEEDLTYTLDPSGIGTRGEFNLRALWKDLNYTCAAQAKGVVKNSEVLTVRPKVSVSRPKISVPSKPILGKPFTIRCESDSGSLPINYTLIRGLDYLDTTTVALAGQRAEFNVTITKPSEINEYMCEAKNSQKHQGELSLRLQSDVVEPLRDPLMTVLPDLNEIYEGGHLNLICGTKGSPPVTFKWFREGVAKPLNTTTILSNNTDYHIPSVSKEHSGTYYCVAHNHANSVSSDRVTIEVRMALWKKAMIVGFCLLALTVLVLVCVLYFRSKRGKREAAAELSVKPSSPKSDDSLTVNLTHDTEVYKTATVRRVDKAAVSVWTKRPSESDAGDDEESSVVSNEPDVEYTEVVHPRPVDPARVPLRKGTDTVYSELQNSPHGAADHHDYGSVEYAELNGEQPEINHHHPEVNSYQDLPEPVD